MSQNNKETALLSPDFLLQESTKKLAELELQLQNVCRRLEKAPEGILRESENHNTIQFYSRSSSGDRQGTYIKKKHWDLAAALAKKDYDEKLKAVLLEQVEILNDFCRQYRPNKIDRLYDELSEHRKKFVNPIYLPDDVYIEEWKQDGLEINNVPLYKAEFETSHGTVRSKSETIIADSLLLNKVPFKYERALSLIDGNNHKTLFPDFCCLNIRTRKEFYWEHFGLLDDLEYRNKMIRKLNLYSENGYVAGKNLIVTFETGGAPFTQKQAELMIQNYLK